MGRISARNRFNTNKAIDEFGAAGERTRHQQADGRGDREKLRRRNLRVSDRQFRMHRRAASSCGRNRARWQGRRVFTPCSGKQSRVQAAAWPHVPRWTEVSHWGARPAKAAHPFRSIGPAVQSGASTRIFTCDLSATSASKPSATMSSMDMRLVTSLSALK